jgi:hypothetical protein
VEVVRVLVRDVGGLRHVVKLAASDRGDGALVVLPGRDGREGVRAERGGPGPKRTACDVPLESERRTLTPRRTYHGADALAFSVDEGIKSEDEDVNDLLACVLIASIVRVGKHLVRSTVAAAQTPSCRRGKSKRGGRPPVEGARVVADARQYRKTAAVSRKHSSAHASVSYSSECSLL